MSGPAFALFDTALGRCAIAWSTRGVAAVSFPEAGEAETKARLMKRAPGAAETVPPEDIRRLIDDIATLLKGEKRDLSSARLDMTGVGEFEQGVYRLTRAIAPGATKTYGDIARALGDAALSQRVGQALARNPFPIIVPCHRVVGVDGRMVGFSAPGGAEAKRKLLKIEGTLAPDLFDAF